MFSLRVTAPRWAVVALLVTMAEAPPRRAMPTARSGPVVALSLIMTFAPLRLPVQGAAATGLKSGLLLNLEQARSAADPGLSIVATDGGAAFSLLLGGLLRREQEQRRELEAARNAERIAAALAERSRLARP